MKNVLLSLFILLTSFFVKSQVSSYTFVSSAGTYTPITGGSNADNFTTWTNTAFFDDGVYTPQPIGFNFTYEGSVFTTFGISQNGFIILGATPTGTDYIPISSSANSISPMGNDIIGRGSLRVSTTNANPTVTVTSGDISQILVGDKVSGTGIPGGATVSSKTATTITMSANATSTGTLRHFRFSRNTFGIRYLTSGTAPNRTCTIQFTGFQRYTTSGYFGELYNFQIKLNETTNTIQFVYNILGPGLGSGSATATTFQVGIRGATAFNNRTTTTNWASTTAGTLNSSTVTLSSTVKPVSGLTYTWTPPSCVAPSSLLVTYTSSTSANLSWATSPSLPTNGYEWEIRTSGLGGSGATGLTASGSVGAGVTSSSTSSLTQNTTYILYVRSNCGGTYSSWNVSASSTSPLPPPSNDYCSGPTNVPCGTSSLAGTTVGTVVETAPFSLSSNYGVWYTFVGDGQQTTITSTTTFDHSLLFMSGSCSGLSYINNIDNSFSTETYTFTTTVGIQYYIYVAHYLTSSTSTGTFTISRTCIAPPTPPVNDNPSGAISITINTGTYSTYTNVNATSTSVTSPSCASYTGEDVWFSVVVPSGGIVELDMIEGVITDGGMSVYTGSIGSLTEIACDDDSSPNGAMSYLYLSGLSVGQTIYVRVWEYGGGTTGTFGILANSPIGLPIELLSFGGTVIDSRNVLLEWSTASELNNDYFIIERSTDGYNWTQIKNIDGSGNSNTKINYTTIDNSAPRTIVYYKLSQVDFDGISEEFSPINVNLTLNEKNCDYKFYELNGKLIDINLVSPGVYLRSCDGETIKIWKY
jgi:hypothetical protein